MHTDNYRSDSVPRPFFLLTLPALLAAPAAAQGSAFQSPGMPPPSSLGQSDRFSSDFNPAIGAAIDGFASYLDADGAGDGFDLELRLIEVNLAANVDPDLWAYIVLTSEGGETVAVEEAAVQYTGLDSNLTFKAGRFFVDFGKQMQQHPEELRTLERPLVLREFLGDELAGTGVQADWWTPLGDATPLRLSLAAFSSLAGGHGHGEEDGEAGPEALAPGQKQLDEFSLTARATFMHELSESSVLQFGSSLRHLPDFYLEDDANPVASAEGLSNSVFGVDLTYGWTDETGLRGLTLGGEYLVYDGDLAAELVDPDMTVDSGDESFAVFDDSVQGYFAFADYRLSPQWSTGVQYSWSELPEGPNLEAQEFDSYLTYHATEFRRLRLGFTLGDSDLEGDTSRVYLQFTAFIGAHSHGLNW
ncbi:hypothetical protein [Engelhardtia mirabilis]|uniref:Zinc-regulated TonB-dependent outer membrane receptor n=1 Tax=Engelhardtia mirabilis TaxID=2528011 RepID=A0A518BQA8_9BACT|nr:hypothetical protein Pla133_42790 [Planctomycetes bacterium Pla133]QDV03489.1 hypothetical protein Pla86_42780 [Planctomycetes bacterium Pla86]